LIMIDWFICLFSDILAAIIGGIALVIFSVNIVIYCICKR
jgi:hypothetical protein